MFNVLVYCYLIVFWTEDCDMPLIVINSFSVAYMWSKTLKNYIKIQPNTIDLNTRL